MCEGGKGAWLPPEWPLQLSRCGKLKEKYKSAEAERARVPANR